MNYSIPDGKKGHEIEKLLAKRFGVTGGTSEPTPFKYYDTFDWRFHKRGLHLLHKSGRFSLLDFLVSPEIEEAGLKIQYKGGFSWDYPPSGFRDALAEIMDPRALRPVVQGSSRITTLNLLNKDQKTVVRITIEEAEVEKGKDKLQLTRRLTLRPVRGYDKELSLAQKILEGKGMRPGGDSFFEEATALLDVHPGDYSGKVSFKIPPGQCSRQVAKGMVASLLQVARQNEAGILSDHDSEYLHDFRVSIRKVRSILSLVKEVFPEDLTQQLKNDFRGIGTATGPVRDLDVYLLSRDDYIDMVPEAQKQGIRLLFKDLEKRRKRECAKLNHYLESKAYRGLMEEKLQLFRSKGDHLPKSKNSGKPIAKLAEKTLQKRYAKIIGMGNLVTMETPDEDVHELRIECKKLRYLLEFFQSLLNKKAVSNFVKQLKLLQDNLGRFNDLCVQQEYMNKYLSSISPRRKDAPVIIPAVGTLIGVLYKEQTEEKAKVETNVLAFISHSNQELFSTIFKAKA